MGLMVMGLVSAAVCGCGRIVVPVEPTAKLREIQISCAQNAVPANIYVPCEAIGIYSDGSQRNVTLSAEWISDDASVLQTSSQAQTSWFRGINTGYTAITARIGGVEARFSIVVTAAVPVSVTITPANQSFSAGTKQQFTAVCIFSDNTFFDVTDSAAWSVQDTNIGQITATQPGPGMFTAVDVGTTNVSASFEGVSSSTQVTVTGKTLMAILVNPNSSTVVNGLSTAFTAQGIYTDLSTSDLTSSVTWSVINGAIGSISNLSGQQGVFTGFQAGTTQVRASLNGFFDDADVTVTSPTLTSVTLSPVNSTVSAGMSQNLTATGHYSDGSSVDVTSVAVWSSDNTGSATVSNVSGQKGRVTAVASGSANITATYNGVSGLTGVTVLAATLNSIVVTPATSSIAKGLTVQYVATGHYSDGSTSDISSSVTWSTGSTAVATISNSGGSRGLAAGAGIGATTVTATSGSVSGSANITVTAATLVSIAVTPANSTILLLGHKQMTATGTYTDGSQVNITESVTWSSSNTGTATVSNTAGQRGRASGIGLGSTTITATHSGGVSGSTQLNGIL